MARRIKVPTLASLARSYQRNLRTLSRGLKLAGVAPPKLAKPATAVKRRTRAAAPARSTRPAKPANPALVPAGATTAAPAAPAARAVGTECKSARKAPAAALGQWLSGIAPGPAGARRYHLYVPPGVSTSSRTRLPLMVMLHGCGQTGHGIAASSRMNERATRERFLVLYPEQERVANAQGCWRWFERQRGRTDAEAATLLAAVDQVQERYPVHPDRIALAGLSAGATMAAWMALKSPGRFCALAMHSGAAPGSAESAGTALAAMRGDRAPHAPEPATSAAGLSAAALADIAASGAVLPDLPPLLLLHGEADHVVSCRNADLTAEWWADALGARASATRTQQRGKRHAMQVTEYRARGKVQVVLRKVAGLSHAWSGGAANVAHSDPAGPDATALIWAFVARQFEKR